MKSWKKQFIRKLPTVGRFSQIVCLSVIAVVLYGVLHGQITARLCIEYFTVAHTPIVASTEPGVVGLFWGIFATWWVGIPLGCGLAAACCLRPIQTMPPAVILPLLRLLCLMGLCAFLGGLAGYGGFRMGWLQVPEELADCIPAERHVWLVVDSLAHLASYVAGFLGGFVLILLAALGHFATELPARREPEAISS